MLEVKGLILVGAWKRAEKNVPDAHAYPPYGQKMALAKDLASLADSDLYIYSEFSPG